jgi:hypothetical protein
MPELFSEKPSEKKDGAKPEKPSIADGEVTTPNFEFNAADVISAECTLGDKVPGVPVGATLELSIDGTKWQSVSAKAFGYLVPGRTYRLAWDLAEYEVNAHPAIVTGDQFGGWKQVRIKFLGDASLSISAYSALGAKEVPKDDHSKKPHPAQPAAHR